MNAPTDTSEKGLEDLIVRSLVEEGISDAVTGAVEVS